MKLSDEFYLQKAIDEGNKVPAPYNFGAVVVKDGEVVSAEHGSVFESFDPSAHSEVNALKEAGKNLQKYPLEGCTLYASHEPCIMCLSCAAWAKIERIVYCTSKKDQTEIVYEYSSLSIEEANSKLLYPIKIEQLDIKKESY